MAPLGPSARKHLPCFVSCASGTQAVCAAAPSHAPVVVLTREKGKNDKMMSELTARQMQCIELPLIEHTAGEDR